MKILFARHATMVVDIDGKKIYLSYVNLKIKML